MRERGGPITFDDNDEGRPKGRAGGSTINDNGDEKTRRLQNPGGGRQQWWGVVLIEEDDDGSGMVVGEEGNNGHRPTAVVSMTRGRGLSGEEEVHGENLGLVRSHMHARVVL